MITFLILWSSAFSQISVARLPQPIPRSFVNLSSGEPCADGSHERARIDEKKDTLYLTRQACKKIKAKKLALPIPQGMNAIDASYLVYDGRLFEEFSPNLGATTLFCRMESGEKLVKVIVRTEKSRDIFLLGAAESRGVRSEWTMVQAKLDGHTFYGEGDIVKSDFVRLKTNEARTKADVEYSFETGTGKVGERPRWAAKVADLSCYQH